MVALLAGPLAMALALGIAALLSEQALRLLRLPTRGAWLGALSLSALLPLVARWLPPLPAPGWAREAWAAWASGAWPGQAPAPPAHGLGAPMAASAGAPGPWPALAAALSATLLAWFVFSYARLWRESRAWPEARIDGQAVRLAPQAGPAVLGWWRPQVVLPAWLAREASPRRRLALAHERSHVAARDPLLLALALLLVAAAPWNLPLWWQLRRLRAAIEVDCDRRVLRAGGDLLGYCEALIELGQLRGARRGLMAAVDRSHTLLERRIRIMSSRPARHGRAVALACAALAATLATGTVAMAAGLQPKTPPPPAASPSLPAPPALPVIAALPSPPAPPAAAAPSAPPPLPAGATAGREPQDEPVDPTADSTLEDAKREAEEAQLRAEEAKRHAEEAEAAALEAKRDAEQQLRDAEQAKHAAEAVAAEAAARKRDYEAAARAGRTAH